MELDLQKWLLNKANEHIKNRDERESPIYDFLRGADTLYTKLKDQIEWVGVNERSPDPNEEVMVKGGLIADELNSPYEYNAAHCVYNDGQWEVMNVCGYSVWVRNPTHWRKVEK